MSTASATIEAALNLACVGAAPVALVNNLNFGNPEHPEVMWELAEAVDGIAEACLALGIPVIGGNVSLYNESRGSDIDPSPVVAVVGMVDRLDRRPPGAALADGQLLVLVGDDPEPALGGSRWARDVRGVAGGALPELDLSRHAAVADVVRAAVVDGLLGAVHDVSEGGLAVAVAEMAVRAGVGARVEGVADVAALFSEAPSRVVACVAPALVDEVARRAQAAGVAVANLGTAGGDRLVVRGLVDVSVGEAVAAWTGALPGQLQMVDI